MENHESIQLGSHSLFIYCLFFILCCWCCSVTKHVWFFATPWTPACQACLSFTISQSLLKLMSIELVMLSNHLFSLSTLIYSFFFLINFHLSAVVLASAVQQSESVTHIHIFPLFKILIPYASLQSIE